jgi:streptogramin lyase
MVLRQSLQRLTAAAVLLVAAPSVLHAQIALTGQVSSAEEGAMEGVVVSAKKDGSTITISVVSDKDGRFRFPAQKLEPGHYALSIRAVGYDLSVAAAAEVAAAQTATADLKLRKTNDLSTQLTNAEWLMSMVGTEAQKKALLNCTGCHTLERIVKSHHTPDEFMAVFDRMQRYFAGTLPDYPQLLPGDVVRVLNNEAKSIAEFLAANNLSKSETIPFPLKTLPRPKGRATHVIVTEYDLPRKQIQPHDVVLDADGIAWFSEFGEALLGRLDPKTGEYREFKLPVSKPNYPLGSLDLEIDRAGNVWVGMMYQASVAKFDRKIETVQLFAIPAEWQKGASVSQQVTATNLHVDGKVWVKNQEGNQILRLEPATGTWENLGAFKDPASGRNIAYYGIPSDQQNNLYLLDISAGLIGKLDAKTKQIKVYHTPTPNSRPRRGRVDAQNRLWFGEFAGNAVAMFDPKEERIHEWVASPWSNPYDAVADKNGEAWAGSMSNDRIARLAPKSGEFVDYLLPRPTNIRRVFVDDTTTPVTFWAGNNHGASVVKLEPLD